MFQHILVPLDGSRLAEAALPPASQLASKFEGKITLVRVANGEPVAEIILEIAEGIDADTIVMSTHGRGGLSRWVYGSVADKVLRHTARDTGQSFCSILSTSAVAVPSVPPSAPMAVSPSIKKSRKRKE
jgi:nucleotide-binding universal stress UspA family protein